ncbi:MAG: AAA family ATPase, partial [Spirochaetaceae bacterium]|nr:AAA family ATPase [Spirochaetaceae bacterium]
MKILNLIFKNINSLAGVWRIDFTDTAFNSGIFILHGATGAGKTSILDALCLALYGKTSRQSSFNKMQNEVMTKGTSSCLAQVDFETNEGHYRAYWEHKKSKNGIDFQNGCTRRIYKIEKDEPVLVAERINEVNNNVTSILGMDFEQFTSAVLLPQGKFDAFLTAEKKQRSEILEKISRTQIYSKIGAAVHRRLILENDKLNSLKDKIGEIHAAPEAEEAALREKIKASHSLLETKKLLLAAADLQLKQYEEYNKIKAETAALNDKIERLKKNAEDERERFACLEQAKKAGSIADIVLQFEKIKGESERLEAEIQKIKNDLDAAHENRTRLLPVKEAAALESGAAEKELNENEPRIKKARELDARILEIENNLADKREKAVEFTKINNRHDEDFRILSERNERIHEGFGALKAKISVLKDEISRNRARQDDISESMAALSIFSATASFEENRKSLHDGEPCPLCGSREHPFCDDRDNLYEKQSELKSLGMENIKLKQAIASAERALVKLENEKSQAETEISGFEAKRAAYHATKKSAENQEAALRKEAADCAEQAANLKTERGALISVSGIDLFEKELKERAARSAANLVNIDRKLSEYTRDAKNYTRQFSEKEYQYKTSLRILEQKQNSMEAAFAANGFDSYNSWKAFSWSAEKIAEIERAKAYLDNELKNALEQKTKWENAVKNLPPLPEDSCENIEAERRNITSTIESTNKEIGGIEKQLEINEVSRRRKLALEEEIAGQTEICGRWKLMDDWIGGIEGWKFKNYVQALTLKSLIHNANAYLLSMSSQRYMMVCRESTDELLPVIIDRYQGSIERGISNLSGGERFMLSLSLALGLSKLNSSKLSIDSLFLDEGFGTLDKESLELTINILNGLKQYQGKLTGIISHV